MKGFRLLLAVGIVFSSWCALFASEDTMFIRGIRPLGMGGAFVAIADDQNAVFYNPAGLTQRQSSQFTLFELPVNINENAIDIYNFYNNNESRLKNFENLSIPEKEKLINEINSTMIGRSARVRAGLLNMNYLSGSGRFRWGAGLFNQERFEFEFNPPIIIPTVNLVGHADVAAIAPVAYRFEKLPYSVPGKLSIGATLKYINRAKVEELNKSVLEFDKLDPTLQWGQGLGADLGTLYQPNTRWNIGMQVSDIGGTSIKYAEVIKDGTVEKGEETAMIKPIWNVGTAFIPSKIYYWPHKSFSTKDRLILACDVRDFMSTDERVTDATFFKKLHMGAEFRWGPMSLRSGVSSGYPSFGAGFRAPYLGFRVEYAYWADELGRYAGQRPDWNHQVTIAFSWGDSKGRAYGSAVKSPASAESAVVEASPSIKPAVVPADATITDAEAQVQTINQGTTAEAVSSITSDASAGAMPAAAPEKPADSNLTNKDQEPTNAN